MPCSREAESREEIKRVERFFNNRVAGGQELRVYVRSARYGHQATGCRLFFDLLGQIRRGRVQGSGGAAVQDSRVDVRVGKKQLPGLIHIVSLENCHGLILEYPEISPHDPRLIFHDQNLYRHSSLLFPSALGGFERLTHFSNFDKAALFFVQFSPKIPRIDSLSELSLHKSVQIAVQNPIRV